jgi:hypothetical protein
MRVTGFAAIAFLGVSATCVDIDEPATGAGEAALEGRELPVLAAVDELVGLDGAHGLEVEYGLAGPRGLVDGGPLMATAEARTAVGYLVRCALPAGRSITKRAPDGAAYTFHGLIGLAPAWESAGCDRACQEWTTACVLAHVNTAGEQLPLWIVADEERQPQIGWGLDPAYPHQEGAYFGNLFRDPPAMHYCAGRDYDVNPTPGRIGWEREIEAYLNPWGDHAPCVDHCTAAIRDGTTSGFLACDGYQAVMTVWRP